jgi:hypothetical protein
MTGAGDGIRTRDIDLGKVALYQLSYSRLKRNLHCALNASNLSNHGIRIRIAAKLLTYRDGFPGAGVESHPPGKILSS